MNLAAETLPGTRVWVYPDGGLDADLDLPRSPPTQARKGGYAWELVEPIVTVDYARDGRAPGEASRKLAPLELLDLMRTWPQRSFYVLVRGRFVRVHLSGLTRAPCPDADCSTRGYVPFGEVPELLDDTKWWQLYDQHQPEPGPDCLWCRARGQTVTDPDPQRQALVHALLNVLPSVRAEWDAAARVLADYDREHGTEHYDPAQEATDAPTR